MKNAMTEWPNGGMKFPKQDIRSPLDFEQMAKLVRPEDFEGRMLISSDPETHREGDPEVPRPRLRPDLPPQRRPEPDRVDRGLRPRGPAQAHRVRSPAPNSRRAGSLAAHSEAHRWTITIGALLWPQTDSWPTLRDAAIRADEVGLDSLWTWDHLNAIVGTVGAADPRGLDDPRGPRRRHERNRRSG